MKFTVDRSRWRCGLSSADSHGKGLTLLRNSDGYLCCLGFVTEQCGLEPRGTMPSDLCIEYLLARPARYGTFENTKLACAAMIINDRGYTRAKREELLTHLFESHGHKLVFEGDYEIHS